MNSHNNAHINNGKASFSTIIVKSDIGVPNTHFTASIALHPEQFVRNRYAEKPFIPTFQLGSLVIFESEGVVVHAGIVTEVDSGTDMPKFMIDVWPVCEAVTQHQAKTSGALANRLARYIFDGTAGRQDFIGLVWKLGLADSDYLRSQIGSVVPQNILEIFWSEAERQQIESDQAAQKHFEEMASALIESL